MAYILLLGFKGYWELKATNKNCVITIPLGTHMDHFQFNDDTPSKA